MTNPLFDRHGSKSKDDQAFDSGKLAFPYEETRAISDLIEVGILTPYGDLSTAGLRIFLMDPQNRETKELDVKMVTAGTPLSNQLSHEAILPLVVWATGVSVKAGSSVSDYFYIDANRSLLCTYAEIHRELFMEKFLPALIGLSEGISEEVINPSNAKVSSILRSDPIECCELLIRTLSPQEGFGVRQLAAALKNFRKIMQARD